MAGPMAPTMVLVLSLAAALATGPGSLLGARSWIASYAIGWGAAAAAGLMFGIGYVLLSVGQGMAPGATLLGAAAGLCLVRLADRTGVSAETDAAEGGPATRATATGLLIGSGIHSAAEGVAIGAAAAAAAPLAEFLLLTFAIHNASEGAVLGAELTGRGWRGSSAAVAAVVARSSQPLMAVLVTLLLRALPPLLPWCIGASFGALLYLIVAELLPQSYRHAGRTGIAVVVCLAAGMVALLGHAP